MKARRVKIEKPIPAVTEDAVADYVLERQIGYLIRRAHQRASAIFEQVMGDFEVTPVQFAVLAKLHDFGPTSQNQLGRSVGADPATMFGIAARLVKRGLLTQAIDPNDARLVILELSPQGRALTLAMKAEGATVTARTLEPLTEREQREIVRLLEKLG
ncbi:MAG: MarR family transcriptional regulator [Beijerinckiaceae bacterium]|jgi:DNA-binding MarR family transcriptional regulator|nr:MarR family transcriptional regulator [Beijerinckiaceae bacterium]